MQNWGMTLTATTMSVDRYPVIYLQLRYQLVSGHRIQNKEVYSSLCVWLISGQHSMIIFLTQDFQ